MIDIVHAVRKALRDRQADLSAQAAGGSPADWARYQRLVGQIDGLITAEGILIEVAQTLAREE